MILSAEERKTIADLLLVSAVYLRYLADDVGPRISPMLSATLAEHADTADTLRRKLGGK